MRDFLWSIGLGAIGGAAALYTFGLLEACGPKVPTVNQQAGVASYTAALEACVAEARATDGGLSGYRACKAHVNAAWGRDAGGEP